MRQVILRLGLVTVLAVGPVLVPAGAAAQPAAESSAVTLTETITDRGLPAGAPNSTYDVSVKVSKTKGLADRQQVAVELDGFRPSATRDASGARIAAYPVVVMQCRGAEPTPETCAHRFRDQYDAGYDAAAPGPLADTVRKMLNRDDTTQWPGRTDDRPPITDEDRESAAAWDNDNFSIKNAARLRALHLPFVAADRVSFLGDTTRRPDNGALYIDEPFVKSGPPFDTIESTRNDREVLIRPDGTNELLFEARERASQPSLGCSASSPCSLVVVPILTMACAADAPPACSTAPTEVQQAFHNERVWMAPSNWGNRLEVPLEFAPDPAFCGIDDPRPVLDLFGSELIDVAQQRWGAAYCDGARPADYLPGYGQGSEFEARQQFTTSIGPRYQQDAILTSQPVTDSPRPVVHAPSAVTGFTVAFAIDDGRGVQVQEITLSPRLLAKLITESYALDNARLPKEDREQRQQYTGQPITTDEQARGYFVEHPATAGNPASVFYDKEFTTLNPTINYIDADGLRSSQFGNVTGKSPVLFGVVSDVMLEVSRYIVADPAARAWLDGAPDEGGMVVNPAWLGTKEFDRYTQRDTWVRTAAPIKDAGLYESRFAVHGSGDGCDASRGAPRYSQLATVLSSVEASAQALLDRRGRANRECKISQVVDTSQPSAGGGVAYTDVREPIQEFGKRAMLAVTSVPHANQYSLPTARLINAGGQAVAPTDGTMLAALGNAIQDPRTGTVRLDHANVRGDAYPGTMVTYTAAPTAGLAPDLAGDLADFMTFMGTEGQRRVGGPSDLPAGYDPLPPAMVQQATEAAEAVRTQSGTVPPPPPGGPLGGGTTTAGPGGSGPAGAGPSGGPGGGAGLSPASTTPAVGNGVIPADSAVAAGDQPGAADAGVRPVAGTRGDQSWLGRWGLLIVLLVGAIAAVGAGVLRLTGRPESLRAALRAVGLDQSAPRS